MEEQVTLFPNSKRILINLTDKRLTFMMTYVIMDTETRERIRRLWLPVTRQQEDMVTLQEVFEQARQAECTMAADEYSGHGRKLARWTAEIAEDNEDYTYDAALNVAQQNVKFPSNEWRFW